MSTRSFIGMVKEDGNVVGIYCHFDGFLTHQGPILTEYYSDIEKVKQLIDLGSISVLAEQIGDKHDINNIGCKSWVKAFVRDLGHPRSENEPIYYVNESESLTCFNGIGVDYCYIFKNGKWFYATRDDSSLKEIDKEYNLAIIKSNRITSMRNKFNNKEFFVELLFDKSVDCIYRVAIDKFINDSRPSPNTNANASVYWEAMFSPLDPDLTIRPDEINSDECFDGIFNLGRLLGSKGAGAKCYWLEVDGVQVFWVNKTPEQIAKSMALFSYGLI